MPRKPTRVVCDRCGWRTTRVYMDCECDGEYGCRCGPRVAFGECQNHPGVGMRTPEDIRDEAAFMASLPKETPDAP